MMNDENGVKLNQMSHLTRIVIEPAPILKPLKSSMLFLCLYSFELQGGMIVHEVCIDKSDDLLTVATGIPVNLQTTIN